MKILIVDDEQFVCEVLEASLADVASEVTSCIDPEEALKILETQSFDIIITDFIMPKLNGAEFKEKVPADRFSKFFLLTGEPSVKQEIIEKAAFDKVLYKPEGMMELVDILEEM